MTEHFVTCQTAIMIAGTDPDRVEGHSDSVTYTNALLSDVAMVSADLAWAVGQSACGPVLLRWDGRTWSPARPPAAPESAVGTALLGIDAVSQDAAIAVGGLYDRLAGIEYPVAVHWDGNRWANAPGLDAGCVLTSVAMLAPDEAWAVGNAFTGRGLQTSVSRWDGHRWRPVHLPGRTEGHLQAVAAAGGHVWAAGETTRVPGGQPMILHWNGRRWRRPALPAMAAAPWRPLTSLAALSPTDVWAAGGGILLHWDGRGWSAVEPPFMDVNTVTARSATDIWVAGGRGDLARYDGERWTAVASPHKGAVWLGSTSLSGGPLVIVGSSRVQVPAASAVTA